MRPPSKNNDDVLDAERLRQIARRKEQNRNAQRRLRERKEEYTMQLEAQLADLHRRSQSQEEESHFLREALARMRAENQTLAEQITMIHQAVPSTQTSHPLPQRASSIDLGIDPFAHTISLTRNRNRSQSATASTMPHFAFGPTAAPWATTSQHALMPDIHSPPFGATIAPGATHRLPFTSVPPLPGKMSFSGGLTMPHHDLMEDVAMPQSEGITRRSSRSFNLQRRDSAIFSPPVSRGTLSRHGSGQIELTVPIEHSDAESGPSTNIARASASSTDLSTSMGPSPSPSLGTAPIPSKTMEPSAPPFSKQSGETHAATIMPPTSDDVMASCLESIHSLPLGDLEAAKQTEAPAGGPWTSSGNEISGQLSLHDFRHSDLTTIQKPLGLTPSALGLNNMMPGTGAGGDGWTISPWLNFNQTPSAGVAADMDSVSSRQHAGNQRLDMGMAFSSRKSLASRRGFSGSLSLEARAI
ncbi:uncharacterized protein MEPE_03639 [Melanopsichium pennsylvanicum]|uniref:BZIP domain-containing protein n=2 Tax=Melanopsichium pennsylvanicum TaxID=63383 RepID=A0AAJ5C5N5_9BASI|nr:bzip family transcription factor [Melanopsichium pennsylvanicum 4]SNX84930.1 uncharacterized protein MEPE_03639 [Melanopsichium pennsylvanicum]